MANRWSSSHHSRGPEGPRSTPFRRLRDALRRRDSGRRLPPEPSLVAAPDRAAGDTTTVSGSDPPLRVRALGLGLVLGLPVSAFFLWLAVRRASLDRVWDTLRDADLGLALVAVATMALVYSIQAERWSMVASRAVPRWRFLGWVVTAVAVNNVLPARVGDVLRGRWLARSSGLPTGRGIGVVIIDRAFDVIGLGLLLALSMPRVLEEGWAKRIAVGTAALLVLLAAFLLGSRIYTRRRARGRRERGRLRRVIRDGLDGLAQPVGRRRFASLATLSVAAWLAWALGAMLVARAVGINLGFLDAVFVTAIINLGVAIPSSPGFVGTYQWLSVSALGVLAVPRESALAFAILMQAVWYIPTTLVGASLLAVRGVTRVRARREEIDG